MSILFVNLLYGHAHTWSTHCEQIWTQSCSESTELALVVGLIAHFKPFYSNSIWSSYQLREHISASKQSPNALRDGILSIQADCSTTVWNNKLLLRYRFIIYTNRIVTWVLDLWSVHRYDKDYNYAITLDVINQIKCF